MKKLFIITVFLFSFFKVQSQFLMWSDFYQTNISEYRIHSMFGGGTDYCFNNYLEIEFTHQDTLFYCILFDFRNVVANGLGCGRNDTILPNTSNVNYINVSTGYLSLDVQFEDDTTWFAFDSTFTLETNAIDEYHKGEFVVSCQNQELTVSGTIPIYDILLVDLMGKVVSSFRERVSLVDVHKGVYLLYIFPERERGDIITLKIYL